MTLPVDGIGGAAAAVGAGAAPQTESKAVREAAEGFERLLLGQLTRSLLDSALPEEGASAATSAYKGQLPDALTEALMSGGGIGLAATLKGVDR